MQLLANFRKDKLIINAGYILGVQVFPGLIGLGYWAVAGHFLTIEDIGVLSAVLSLVALLSSISTMGLNIAIIRYLPESKDRSRLINVITSFVVFISLFVGVIFIFGIGVWGQKIILVLQSPLSITIFLAYIAFMAIGNIIQNTFIAYREAIYGLRYTLISQSLRFIFLLLCMVFGFGLQYLIGSNLLAVLLIVLYSLYSYLPKLEQNYKPVILLDIKRLKQLIPYGLGNYLATFLQQLPQLIFPILVLEILGASANGYAYIPIMLGGFLLSPGLSLASSAFAEGAHAPGRSREILSKASLIGVVSTLVVAAFIIFFSERILHLFGLNDAVESVKLLRWLALASPIVVFNQLYFTQLRLVNRVFSLIVLSSIIAFLTIIISIIYLPKIGIVACGIGILISNAVIAIPLTCYLILRSLNRARLGGKPITLSDIRKSNG